MADNEEKQGLSSEILNIVEQVQSKYLHLIFLALFFVFSLHLAGFELTQDFPYIQVSEDGMNKPLSTGLALLFAGLWLWLWRQKNIQIKGAHPQQNYANDGTENTKNVLIKHLESAISSAPS